MLPQSCIASSAYKPMDMERRGVGWFCMWGAGISYNRVPCANPGPPLSVLVLGTCQCCMLATSPLTSCRCPWGRAANRGVRGPDEL